MLAGTQQKGHQQRLPARGISLLEKEHIICCTDEETRPTYLCILQFLPSVFSIFLSDPAVLLSLGYSFKSVSSFPEVNCKPLPSTRQNSNKCYLESKYDESAPKHVCRLLTLPVNWITRVSLCVLV